jgi:hypothetical protein
MKIKIPDELKSTVPQTIWGRILTATPVIMTVVATALAGLASSEMTRAQYNRSLAAQRQSKAGDQWGFFQAKRLRGALQRSTLDVLQSTIGVQPFTAGPALPPAAVAALERGELPALEAGPDWPPPVKSALEAVDTGKPDAEVAKLILALSDRQLEEAVRAAKAQAAALDRATEPVNAAIARLEAELPGQRDLIAARLRYSARRYDAEARLNQGIAQLYELQVRKSNLIAERHHRRSQRFFFGMLAAQAAVIMSTFAIATQKRSLMWSLAAAAGAAAVSFGIYVYLFV